MWGLLVLCVVAASPRRYARQAELDNYGNNNVDLDLNEDGDDVYDYYNGIDEPQVRESFKVSKFINWLNYLNMLICAVICQYSHSHGFRDVPFFAA